MTPREFSIDVVKKLTDAGYVAYWAGGCVRDLLLGKEPNDFDVATNATPAQVRELFGKRRTLAVGESFGVIIVLGPKSAEPVEVATFRSEGTYLDGRRPSSVQFSSAEEDAQRRDFTINGMFFDPIAEQVHDYVGGQADIQRRVIRAIGIPQERMEEDKLRLLRAVRFSALLDFQLEEETAQAVRDMSSQIVVVSAERITQELKKMLSHTRRAQAISLCEELDLLEVILPEVCEFTIQESLEEWQDRQQALELIDKISFVSAMALLLWDVPSITASRKVERHGGTVRSICQRLKLSNQEKDEIDWLVHQRGQLLRFEEMSLAEKKRLAVHPLFDSLLVIELAIAHAKNNSLETLDKFSEFARQTPAEILNPPELVNGKTLIELGHRPGPEFQRVLKAVRDAQLNEEISTEAEALAFVNDLLDE